VVNGDELVVISTLTCLMCSRTASRDTGNDDDNDDVTHGSETTSDSSVETSVKLMQQATPSTITASAPRSYTDLYLDTDCSSVICVKATLHSTRLVLDFCRNYSTDFSPWLGPGGYFLTGLSHDSKPGLSKEVFSSYSYIHVGLYSLETFYRSVRFFVLTYKIHSMTVAVQGVYSAALDTRH